jgi:hypothetical protein
MYDYTTVSGAPIWEPSGAFLAGFALSMLAVAIFFIVCSWKIYQKAGKPGWTSIVPIYNAIIMLDIIRKPRWWIILMIIPYVNLVMAFIVSYHLAKVFGKDIGYMLGLVFLPFIFYPMLAFGSAQYNGALQPQALHPQQPQM